MSLSYQSLDPDSMIVGRLRVTRKKISPDVWSHHARGTLSLRPYPKSYHTHTEFERSRQEKERQTMAVVMEAQQKIMWDELEEDDGGDLDFLLLPHMVIRPDAKGLKNVI
jgi:hypothetical protein